MTKLCHRCGTQHTASDRFCKSCGAKLDEQESVLQTKPESSGSLPRLSVDYPKINRRIRIKNKQWKVVRFSWLTAALFLIVVVLTFVDGSPVSGFFALSFIGIFISISSVVVALVFGSRAKKLDKLISGENVLASWQLGTKEKSEFVATMYRNEKTKNRALFVITTFLVVIIFGAFILLIDEGASGMLVVMLMLITVLALFAFGMPAYYKAKNLKGDGLVLIGKNYAYVNGFFHNWDFPLSGMQEVKTVETPFRGIFIQYYYYDRTLKHTEELLIPAPEIIDLNALLKILN